MDPHTPEQTPDQLAAAVVAAMAARDAASRALGMTVLEANAARVRVRMAVRADMVQAVGSCHGGVIAALADSAFAFACNRGNQITVAAGFTIEFLQPAYAGDVLVAEATEQAQAGRSGVYDVRVSKQDGTTVALFRGKCRRVGGAIVGEPPGDAPEDSPPPAG